MNEALPFIFDYGKSKLWDYIMDLPDLGFSWNCEKKKDDGTAHGSNLSTMMSSFSLTEHSNDGICWSSVDKKC